MPQNNLVENGKLVDQMRYAVKEGEKNIKHIPAFIERVIDTGAWKKRWVVSRLVVHKSFLEFVNEPPLGGMGWKEKQDKEQIESLLRYAPEVLIKWREAIMLPAGTNQYTMVHDNIMHHKKAEQGTSIAYTLDRLERERPDLYDRVVAGELTANAAAIEARFRKKLSKFEQIDRWLPLITIAERRDIWERLNKEFEDVSV